MRQVLPGHGASRGSALGRARVRLPHVLDWLAIHHERFSAGDRETCLWSADRYRTRYVQPIFCVGTWLTPRSQATKKPPQRVALVS